MNHTQCDSRSDVSHSWIKIVLNVLVSRCEGWTAVIWWRSVRRYPGRRRHTDGRPRSWRSFRWARPSAWRSTRWPLSASLRTPGPSGPLPASGCDSLKRSARWMNSSQQKTPRGSLRWGEDSGGLYRSKYRKLWSSCWFLWTAGYRWVTRRQTVTFGIWKIITQIKNLLTKRSHYNLFNHNHDVNLKCDLSSQFWNVLSCLPVVNKLSHKFKDRGGACWVMVPKLYGPL